MYDIRCASAVNYCLIPARPRPLFQLRLLGHVFFLEPFRRRQNLPSHYSNRERRYRVTGWFKFSPCYADLSLSSLSLSPKDLGLWKMQHAWREISYYFHSTKNANGCACTFDDFFSRPSLSITSALLLGNGVGTRRAVRFCTITK